MKMTRFHAGSAILVVIAALLAGCAQSLPYTALPSLEKDNRPLLTKDQQKAAISELEQKKASEQAKAIREIEKAK